MDKRTLVTVSVKKDFTVSQLLLRQKRIHPRGRNKCFMTDKRQSVAKAVWLQNVEVILTDIGLKVISVSSFGGNTI